MEFACPPPPELIPAPAPPTISVVIAAYNAAGCIGDAIRSVQAQTATPLEIVVCDDGSTDALDAALAPFADEIQLLAHASNRGEAAAKNTAIRAAAGEFVAILDADDTFLPGRLAALGELAALRPDLDILTTDAYLELEGRVVRRVYGPHWRFETLDQRAEILRRNFIFGHVAVRRERLLAAGGFDETIRHTTDWAAWIRLILDGARAGAVLEPLSRYSVRQTSLSADRVAMLEGGIASLRSALRHPGIRPAEREVARASIAGRERELAPMQLKRALLSHSPDARRRASALARDRAAPPRARARAALVAMLPAVARWILTRRDGGWVGAGGTRVERG